MMKSIAVTLAALGLIAMAQTAAACPETASITSSQQTVMTDTAPQTPIPTKPGS